MRSQSRRFRVLSKEVDDDELQGQVESLAQKAYALGAKAMQEAVLEAMSQWMAQMENHAATLERGDEVGFSAEQVRLVVMGGVTACEQFQKAIREIELPNVFDAPNGFLH